MGRDHPGYKWVALSNTTLGVLMATINGSIVLISLPAIFRGINLNPLGAGNVSFLLWILMGYLLVTAVLVVSLGRLGDIFGRVRLYNAGFLVFTVGSIALAFDPLTGPPGAIWLIAWRVFQAIGGAMLFANSTAIVVDAFPSTQRGLALGINQVAALAGSFIGLIAGGLLSEWNWRGVFFVSVPVGIIGTVWAYKSLHELGRRTAARIDWSGNVSFAVGLLLLLVAITYGIQPYGNSAQGWGNPWVIAGLVGGVVVLIAFGFIERRQKQPMFNLSLFRSRAFAAGNAVGLIAAIARGGLQFMLIIWLQGIWLPLHGYAYVDTPLWAGIYLLPLTAGFLIAGPVSGFLSDRYGARTFATVGLVVVACSFAGLLLIPVNFSYPWFAAVIAINGIGSGLLAAPNTTAIMNSVPANQRGSASGMIATFQNAGMTLSVGLFFSLMIAGLASSLPRTMKAGLLAQHVPAHVAAAIATLPPVGSLFAAFLGFNPVKTLLTETHAAATIPAHNLAVLTGESFFPSLLSGPFHSGLEIVFGIAIAMSLVAAVISAFRGGRYVLEEAEIGGQLVEELGSGSTVAQATGQSLPDGAAAEPGL